ncbi:MAG: hypothetical protein AAGC93_06920 [Cyanobacteria bacterium P01_F01_bin.53]
MDFKIDHIFILTEIGASAAEQLISSGLVEGSSNTHPGQGTANRRFFFQNAGLELLWAHSEKEATSAPIRRTHLWERWKNRTTSACPFGICLRPVNPSNQELAFPHWPFQPPYLPAPLSIAVGTNSDIITEPMLFQTPFARRPDQFAGEKRQPLDHPLGVKEITHATLTSPMAKSPSLELAAAVAKTEHIKLKSGTEYCIDIGFDGGTQGKSIDLRPALPMTMRW